MVHALYIHTPYCKQKCQYCDFNSYADKNGINKDFINALKEEILLTSEDVRPHRIESIFFGGGTPTILPVDGIIDILNSCFQKFPIGSACEVSIEVNPDTVDYEYLKALRQSGFNRLSFGCQSFNDNLLRKMGRTHNCLDIHQGFFVAQEAGFKNISLDLMFGLPGQDLNLWKETLQSAVQMKPTHLSIYNLTIEKNTPFYDQSRSGQLDLPSEELQLEMYETAIKYLSRNDYFHYEISNFAKKGYECRHNKVYWNNKEYLGFGPSAASYVNGIRTTNILLPDKYVQTLLHKKERPVFEKEELDQKRNMGETLMLGLRLLDGINLNSFEKRFGKSLDSEFGEKIKKLCEEQLLECDKKKLKLTYKGILFSNEVFVELV